MRNRTPARPGVAAGTRMKAVGKRYLSIVESACRTDCGRAARKRRRRSKRARSAGRVAATDWKPSVEATDWPNERQQRQRFDVFLFRKRQPIREEAEALSLAAVKAGWRQNVDPALPFYLHTKKFLDVYRNLKKKSNPRRLLSSDATYSEEIMLAKSLQCFPQLTLEIKYNMTTK